ncbi:MAG TPA: hypothetical protein VHB70_08770 [Parafilimonas sp.]|nr:hypothetical protein [Parafilimonas sp.]
MKNILILVITIICTSTFAQTKDSLEAAYYSNGQVKEKGNFNKAGLKDGEFIYYDSNGNIDSSITFEKGKLNGLKKVYYSNDDIFYFDYHNNKLRSHKIYDSANNLKYESPLDIKNIPKTTYHFTSGRDFYKQGETDTLIINSDVPYLNENVYFPGAIVKSVGKYSWEIQAWKAQPNSTNGKMVIDINQFIVEAFETATKKSKLLRHEVILVPIK